MMIHSLRSIRWWLAAGLLVAVAAMPARGQTTLRWKLQKGEKLGYAMNQRVVTKASFGNQSLESTMNQMIDATWTVNDVAGNGSADVTETIDRIRMTLDQPGQNQKLDYDSKDGKKVEGPLGPFLNPLFDAMSGAQVSFKMNAQGEITDVKLPQKLVDASRNSPGASQFSEEALKKLFTHSILVLPSTPVSKGTSWNKESDIDAAAYKTKLTNMYNYQGPVTQNGAKLEQIDVKIDTKIEAPQAGPQISIKSQDAKGKFFFDNNKGRLAESTLVQKLEIAVTAMNMEYVQSTETTSSMKLNPAG